jgi:HAD superfamily hydrolase (TIGR01509 family)
MRAVLFDMDGTLVDSEKLWDISMHALYERFGSHMSEEIRESTVGGSSEQVMHIVYADLGLDPEPSEMAATADWLNAYTAELFDDGLLWCDGAQKLLDELSEASVPMALVTNTRRDLTERALNVIGRQYFAAVVCGDEVPHGKPEPDPYVRAAELLGLAPADCLAIEDSITGTTSAELAGCPVLVVPNDLEVPQGPRRYHVASLATLDISYLQSIYRDLQTGNGAHGLR